MSRSSRRSRVAFALSLVVLPLALVAAGVGLGLDLGDEGEAYAQSRGGASKAAPPKGGAVTRPGAPKRGAPKGDASPPSTTASQEARGDGGSSASAHNEGFSSAGASDGGIAETKTGDGGSKVFRFGEVEIEGRLRSPQLVYFLRRVRAEFAAEDLGHRTFMRELSETRKDPNF